MYKIDRRGEGGPVGGGSKNCSLGNYPRNLYNVENVEDKVVFLIENCLLLIISSLFLLARNFLQRNHKR